MADRRMMECKTRGCYKLTRNKTGYCDIHEPAYLEKVNKQKQEWKIKNNYKSPKNNTKLEKFYSSKQWQDLRTYVKARDNFLCVDCLEEGRTTIASQVHHIIPVLKDWDKRFDETNLVSLCHKHHKIRHGHRCYFDEEEE